jgi:hypothetical protein
MDDRKYVIDGGKTFEGTLRQFQERFAGYGTATQAKIVELCVDWQCDLYWSIPQSEHIQGRRLTYQPEGLFCVGVLEGQKLTDGALIYDKASGLEVLVVNSQQAVSLNADGTIGYIAWRKNGCWTFTAPSTWESDDPDLDCPIHNEDLEAEVRAWRACFPEYVYSPSLGGVVVFE